MLFLAWKRWQKEEGEDELTYLAKDGLAAFVHDDPMRLEDGERDEHLGYRHDQPEWNEVMVGDGPAADGPSDDDNEDEDDDEEEEEEVQHHATAAATKSVKHVKIEKDDHQKSGHMAGHEQNTADDEDDEEEDEDEEEEEEEDHARHAVMDDEDDEENDDHTDRPSPVPHDSDEEEEEEEYEDVITTTAGSSVHELPPAWIDSLALRLMISQTYNNRMEFLARYRIDSTLFNSKLIIYLFILFLFFFPHRSQWRIHGDGLHAGCDAVGRPRPIAGLINWKVFPFFYR